MGAIELLKTAIGYPEEIVGGILHVDDGEVRVREERGRLIFEKTLLAEDDPSALERLMGYAAGRFLKEEATLAWDPTNERLILWQDVAATASPEMMRRTFEVFMVSCDWWLARVHEEQVDAPKIPEMMIIP